MERCFFSVLLWWTEQEGWLRRFCCAWWAAALSHTPHGRLCAMGAQRWHGQSGEGVLSLWGRWCCVLGGG